MDYEAAYETVMDVQAELVRRLYAELEELEERASGQTVQALAATYTLQDYLAARIAEQGEAPEGAELDE